MKTGDIQLLHETAVGILLFCTIVLSAGFIYYCLRNQEKRGAIPLAVLFLGSGLWALADFIHVVLVETGGDPMAGGGLPIRILGIEIAAIGMLFLGLGYTGREHLISPRTLGILSIKPAITLGLSVSPYRDLLYNTTPADVPLGYELLPTPLFLLHLAYSYGLVVIGLGLVTHTMLRSRYGYQRQQFALFFAILTPLVFSLSFQFGILPFDVAPISFTISGLLLLFAVFRLQLMDAIPVARMRVLDEMEDIVVVLDEDKNILAVNSAAAEIFGSEADLLGKPATAIFDEKLIGNFETGQSEWLTIDGEKRLLNVNASHITDYRENVLAHVLVCRDITGQRQKERKLQEREKELQLLKDIQSNFLQHNLRDELQMVRENAEVLADEDEPQSTERYETLVEKTEQILEWSTKAQTIENLVETEQTSAYKIDEELAAIVERKRGEFPAVRFELGLDAGVEIRTVPQITQALENVVDNAARYNTADTSVVRISTDCCGDRVEVQIADNGPGIDPVEVEAILSGKETDLQHGSGFGLWLVYWVVEKSNGELVFDTGADGTTISLEFERALEQPTDTGHSTA